MIFNGCFFVLSIPLESIQFKKQIANAINVLGGKMEMIVSSKVIENFLILI